MTVAVVVQARLGSTRLPAKVLLPLPTGRTVLEEVLWRCKQIKGVDVVVCAMPYDDARYLVPFVKKAGAVCAFGSEHHVLQRYVEAARKVGAAVIMRVTSDCPLIDPAVCEQVLYLREATDADYSANNMPVSFPAGLDCEAFTMDALSECYARARKDEREHVTTWLRRTETIRDRPIRRSWLPSPNDRSHIRWTLDELPDYRIIWNVFQEQMREAA